MRYLEGRMVKKTNRIIALILAGLMVLGVLGSLYSVLAHAVEVDSTYQINAIYRGGSYDLMFDWTTGGTLSIGSSSTTKTYYVDLVIKVTDPDGLKSKFGANNGSDLDVTVGGGSFLGGGTPTVAYVSGGENGSPLRYNITFSKLEYTGKGRYLRVEVRSKNPGDYEASTSLMIDECVPTKDSDDDDYSEIAVATPYVIVSKYTYGGSQIVAGNTFNLTLTFYNTSIAVDVSNMIVTVAMPEDLMLTSSSNTFYIDWLDRDTTVTKTVQVKAKPGAKAQSHDVKVSMKYQYIDHKQNTRKDSTTDEVIAIPVIQVDRFQASGIDMDTELVVGQESYLSVKYVNKGRSDVYNVSVSIDGNIQNPGQIQNMGNIASGVTGSCDFYIIPAEGGVCEGNVTITYEDTNGQEKTILVPYSAEATDYSQMGRDEFYKPGFVEPMDPGFIEPEAKPVWPFVAGAAAVVVLVVGGIVWKKRSNKKRSDALDADI